MLFDGYNGKGPYNSSNLKIGGAITAGSDASGRLFEDPGRSASACRQEGADVGVQGALLDPDGEEDHFDFDCHHLGRRMGRLGWRKAARGAVGGVQE